MHSVAGRRLVVIVDAARPLPAGRTQRLKRWLAVRVPSSEAEVVLRKAAA